MNSKLRASMVAILQLKNDSTELRKIKFMAFEH